MRELDCAGFEAELARALAAPSPADEGTTGALRRHVSSCAACRGSSGLVDLAAAAAADRDPIVDPGEAYWAGFDRRLAARLGSASAPRPGLRAIGWLGAASAAAAAIAAAVLLSHRPPPPRTVAEIPAPPPPVSPPAATPAPAPAGRIRSTTPGAPRPVDSAGAEEDESTDALAWGAPSDPFAAEDEPGLFPGVEELSAEQRRSLSAWLDREIHRVTGGDA